MTKRTLYTFLILASLAHPLSAQSFADAVKDGFAPLGNLLKGGDKDTLDAPRRKTEIKSVTLKDGTLYTGEMKGKRPHGAGKATYRNGDTYEGGFLKGVRHGQGVYRFKDGETYEGEFLDGKQHGKGVFHFSDGRVYDGNWEEDYQHG